MRRFGNHRTGGLGALLVLAILMSLFRKCEGCGTDEPKDQGTSWAPMVQNGKVRLRGDCELWGFDSAKRPVVITKGNKGESYHLVGYDGRSTEILAPDGRRHLWIVNRCAESTIALPANHLGLTEKSPAAGLAIWDFSEVAIMGLVGIGGALFVALVYTALTHGGKTKGSAALLPEPWKTEEENRRLHEERGRREEARKRQEEEERKREYSERVKRMQEEVLILRRNVLMQKYQDEQTVAGILAGLVAKGMSTEMVLDSLGDPAKVDKKWFITKYVEIWKYDMVSKDRYRLRVRFEGGRVVGIQENDV